MPVQFSQVERAPYVDYSINGRTFRVSGDFPVRKQWCSVCERFETFDFELSIVVSTKTEAAHDQEVAKHIEGLWDWLGKQPERSPNVHRELRKLVRSRITLVLPELMPAGSFE